MLLPRRHVDALRAVVYLPISPAKTAVAGVQQIERARVVGIARCAHALTFSVVHDQIPVPTEEPRALRPAPFRAYRFQQSSDSLAAAC